MLDILFLIEINLYSTLLAFILDMLIGEMPFTHPVVYIGRLISFFEDKFYKDSVITGLCCAASVVLISTILVFFLLYVSYQLTIVFYIFINFYIIYTSISVKSLADHVDDVAKAKNLEKMRKKVGLIVSRETENMSEYEASKAAIESASENFVDGVVAPVFYSALFGSLGAAFFKAVSTLDSMIGYRNKKYEHFGKMAAVFDDILVLIPARLSVYPVWAASKTMGMNTDKVFEIYKKYRKKHDSPNAAHGISSFAGALNLRLGGPAVYNGQLKEKEYIGEGKDPVKSDIGKAVALLRTSSMSFVFFFILVLLTVLWVLKCIL